MAAKMAQQGSAPPTKPDDRSSIPRNHMEGEKQLPQTCMKNIQQPRAQSQFTFYSQCSREHGPVINSSGDGCVFVFGLFLFFVFWDRDTLYSGSPETLSRNQAGFKLACLYLLSAGVKDLAYHFWQYLVLQQMKQTFSQWINSKLIIVSSMQ